MAKRKTMKRFSRKMRNTTGKRRGGVRMGGAALAFSEINGAPSTEGGEPVPANSLVSSAAAPVTGGRRRRRRKQIKSRKIRTTRRRRYMKSVRFKGGGSEGVDLSRPHLLNTAGGDAAQDIALSPNF